jgi:hypothetical protein
MDFPFVWLPTDSIEIKGVTQLGENICLILNVVQGPSFTVYLEVLPVPVGELSSTGNV